jgi:hypothetical protein
MNHELIFIFCRFLWRRFHADKGEGYEGVLQRDESSDALAVKPLSASDFLLSDEVSWNVTLEWTDCHFTRHSCNVTAAECGLYLERGTYDMSFWFSSGMSLTYSGILIFLLNNTEVKLIECRSYNFLIYNYKLL